MREDMDKLLVERPRFGRHRTKTARTERNAKFEDAPTRESIGRARWGRGTKGLNENLRPLEHYLQSHIGDPWDKVYSDIRANVSMDNTVQRHIMQHLWSYVKRHVEERDGKIFGLGEFRFSKGLPTELSPGQLYVCPKTGTLKIYGGTAAAHPSQRRRKKVFRRFSDSYGAYLIDGKWYEVTLSPLPSELLEHVSREMTGIYRTFYYNSVLDVVLGKQVSRTYSPGWRRGWNGNSETQSAYGDGTIYASSKTLLSSKKRKHLGL